MSLRVTMAHVRAERICMRGIRAGCIRHGIDFRAFVRDGMAIEDAERIPDAFVQRVVRRVRAEVANGQ